MTRRDARQTTLLYLLMGLPGIPALAYLPKSFVVSGDAFTPNRTEARLAYAQ